MERLSDYLMDDVVYPKEQVVSRMEFWISDYFLTFTLVMSIERIIENRILQNVLFWTIFAVIPFVLNLGSFGLAANMYTDIQYYLECALLGYLNNLVLMPKILDKKRYLFYSICALGLITLITWTSGLITTILSPTYPQSFQGSLYDGIDYALFVIAFGSGHLIRSYIRQSKQISQLEEDKLKTEIDFLKSQINPHMLFNTLNTIYSHSLTNSKKTPQMILKLSDIMRYMLYETDEERVTLSKELEYIEDYVSMQKLRIGSRGKVNLNVDGDPSEFTIAPMLLISFIENSFKHSMDSMSSEIEIRIEFKIHQGKLELSVKNNYEKNEGLSTGGIGNRNVKKRLELLYPDRHDLSIEKDEQNYLVKLKLILEE